MERPSATARVRERAGPRPSESLAAGLGAAVLFAASLRFPAVGLLAAISPFPLAVLRMRGGAGGALAAALFGGAILASVFSPGQALAFLLVLACPALVLAETMARGRGIVKGCLWAFALLAFEIGAALAFTGTEMAARLLEPLDQYRSRQFLEEMRSSGLPAERVDDWAEQLSTLRKVIEVVYPAAYIIMGALIVLANAALLRAYLARLDPGWLEEGEFERVRWPLGLAVAFVLAGLAVAFPPLRPAGYNLLLILVFFFALQGLAVVGYYAHRLAGPPLLRGAVLVLVLVNPWAPQILALIGLFDTWIDFRRWAEPPEGEPD